MVDFYGKLSVNIPYMDAMGDVSKTSEAKSDVVGSH